MKKILSLLVLILVFNSCDDGDYVIEEINLDDATIEKCSNNNFFYKISGNVAMYAKIPTPEDVFKNELTLINKPRIINIPTATITYRTYNGNVNQGSICESPAPLTPNPTIEWTATSGRIEVTTTIIYKPVDATTGAIKIDKYNHNIVFKDITFLKPDGTNVFYETLVFGDYTTPITLNFNFNAENITKCQSTGTIYNISGTELLYIRNIDANLLSTTTLGVPKTALIGSIENKLTYRLLSNAISTEINNYFCLDEIPTIPSIKEEWIGVEGVANENGIIEITTTTNGTGFKHTIRLKGVTFKKGTSTFYYGNDILIGELLVGN